MWPPQVLGWLRTTRTLQQRRIKQPQRQRLPSASSPALHGYHRGPQAHPAEPVDAWLATLADCAPFYKDSFIVCPSNMSREHTQTLLRRGAAHLPGAHIAPLRPSEGAAFSSTTATGMCSTEASIESSSTSAVSSSTCASTSSPLAVQPTPAEASSLVPFLIPRKVAYTSPLETLPPQSMDVVVFASNVFGEEMLFDAPWHISLAHRVLRPHGVLSIIGHSQAIEVAAPAWARDDAADFMTSLLNEVDAVLTSLEKQQKQHSESSEAALGVLSPAQRAQVESLTQRLRRAREIAESERVGHADVYFPFLAAKRRWYCSEYALQPAELAAGIRAMSMYQLLNRFGDLGINVSDGGTNAVTQSDAMEDFVDISIPGVPSQERGESCVVRRQVGAVDPLEAFQGLLEARLAAEGYGSGKQAKSQSGASAPTTATGVIGVVQHFVLTCSNRSMNAVPDAFRLPSLARGGAGAPRLPK